MTQPYAQLAARQIGLITLTQLRTTGLTVPQVRRLVVAEILVSARTGVYRLAGAPISWDQAVLAAALSAGHGAVVSHMTAAAVWNLRHGDRSLPAIHLSADRLVRIEGVVSHRVSLAADERTSTRSIPVTTPERTILDLAGVLSERQLGQSVDDGIRRGLIGLERLRKLVIRAAVRRGRLVAPVQRVLAERIPGFRPDESDFETEMNRLWDALGLPAARRQHRVVIDGHAYRLDRAIVECRIATEWDSYLHHSSSSDRDYDSDRRARLVGEGWLVIPVTPNSRPDLIARAVLRAYRDRGGGSDLAANGTAEL